MNSPELTDSNQARKQLRCPRCSGSRLEQCVYEGKEVDICPRCGGLWCEPWDWDTEQLGEAPVVGPFLERAADIINVGESRLQCPECARSLTRLTVRAVKNLEIDQCDRCGGVWFDHREWEYLGALRSWQEHRESSDRDTTWSEWFFQLVLQLPVEFNVAPRHFPVVTLTIILVCLCIQILGGAAEFIDYGVRTDDLDTFRWMLTVPTHVFIHAGWLHLLANAYFLFIVGDNIEDVLGPALYFLLFLACGALAALFLFFVAGEKGVTAPLVGASGATAGIMAAYLVLFRNARLTFMLILFQFKLPVWGWMSIWLAIQVLGYALDPGGEITHIGWSAHMGGFLAGLLLVGPFRARLVERHALLHLLHSRRL